MRRAVLLLLLVPAIAGAEGGAYARVGTAWSPVERLQLSVSEELRLGDGLPTRGQWLTDVAAAFRPWGPLSVAGGYRFVAAASEDRVRPAHRLHLDGVARASPGTFELAYRLRFQEKLSTGEGGGVKGSPEIRNRVLALWRTPWTVQPFMGAEVFSDVGAAPEPLALLRFESGARLPVKAWTEELLFDATWRADLSGDRPPFHAAMFAVTWKVR